MRVHPLYDINDKVWVAENGVVAATLRELQAKLPKATIVGYEPNGYVAPFMWSAKDPSEPLRVIVQQSVGKTMFGNAKRQKIRAADVERKRREAIELRARAAEERQQKRAEEFAKLKAKWREEREVKAATAKANGEPTYRRVSHEAVMIVCAKGLTRVEAARELHCSEETIRDHINRGISASDPRAKINKKERLSKFWTSVREKSLRELAAAGKSASMISAAFNYEVTRNSVVSRCRKLGIQLKGKSIRI